MAFALVFGVASDFSRVSLIAVTVLMTQFSISALNDWADRKPDTAAGRAKPLVIGHLPPSVALALAILFALCVLPGGLAFGVTAALVLLIGLAAGWAYDLWLSQTPLSFLPFAIAFPLLPIWVGLVAGRSLASLSWLVMAGALLAIAIHLADSLPDISSDAAAGSHNLAVTLGAKRTLGAIVGLLLAGALVVVFALVWHLVVAVAIGVAALLAAALVGRTRSRPEQARWIVGAFAIIATLALLGNLSRG